MSPSLCIACNGTGRENLRFPSESSNLCDATVSCTVCTKIVDIQKQIDAARRALDELLEEKEALANGFNAKHDQLCCRLPNELVSEIFIQTLPFTPSSTVFEMPYMGLLGLFHKRTLQSLSSVCRRWRTIAQQTPALWTIIFATFDGSSIPKLSVFRDWLQFSGQLPLYLRLYLPSDDHSEQFQAYLPTVLSFLFPHLHQIVVLEIRASKQTLSQFFSHFASLRLQNLGVLFGADFDLKLNTAPRMLRTYPGRTEMAFSDWSTLKELRLACLSEDKLPYILKNASNLSNCKIDLFEESAGLDSGMVVHNALQQFDVTCMSRTLWDKLCFPSLRDLGLHGLGPGTGHATSLIGFLRRSKCPLHSLNYNSISPEEDILQLIAYTPTLVNLTLQPALTASFFRHTTPHFSSNPSEQTPMLLENLEVFNCFLLEAEDFEWGVLIPFLKSRSSGNGGRLRALHIEVPCVTNDEESSEEPLRLDGHLVDSLLDAANGIHLAIYDDEGSRIIGAY